ncbi:UNVERIFIED_CONTAM: hypothetical protein K2H54_024899 [Gekko kuhli]
MTDKVRIAKLPRREFSGRDVVDLCGFRAAGNERGAGVRVPRQGHIKADPPSSIDVQNHLYSSPAGFG